MSTKLEKEAEERRWRKNLEKTLEKEALRKYQKHGGRARR